MPRTLRIDDQGRYDIFAEVVSQPTYYQNILQLAKLKDVTGKKSALEDYLSIYYHVKYLIHHKPKDNRPSMGVCSVALDNLQRTNEFSNFMEVRQIQGPAHSTPESFILPRWNYSIWEYLFTHHSDKLQYLKEETDKFVFTPEAQAYYYACTNPEELMMFWKRLLESKTDFSQASANNKKLNLKDLFVKTFLQAPFINGKLLNSDKTLTDKVHMLWTALCKEPVVYKDLRILFIERLCFVADEENSQSRSLDWGYDDIIQQLIGSLNVVNCYLEFAQTSYGPKLQKSIEKFDSRIKSNINDNLYEMMRADSSFPLSEKEKAGILKMHLDSLNDDRLYDLAHDYAQKNWPVFKQIKAVAGTRQNYDSTLYMHLEHCKHESNKSSWPESFKKLEQVIERIEDYQRDQYGKVPGSFNSFSNVVTRIPLVSNLGASASERLDLGWNTTITQLSAFNSKEGFNLNSINSGYLTPFVEQYRKENFAATSLSLDALPLVLSERLQKIIPPTPAVQQEVKQKELNSI